MFDYDIITLFSALLTPIIALVIAYVAWKQWRVEQAKLKFNLYDKRLKIYGEVRRLLSSILQSGDAKSEDLFRFNVRTSEADFLFGTDIPTYLDEIREKCAELHIANSEFRDNTQPTPEGYDHQAVVARKWDALNWLVAQFDPAKGKFRRYLNVINYQRHHWLFEQVEWCRGNIENPLRLLRRHLPRKRGRN